MSTVIEEHVFVNRLCSECGSSGAHWGSLNRAALLCYECCSIHLGLGRHISEVKLLEGDNWRGKQLNLMKYLYNCSANLVWNKKGSHSLEGKVKQKAPVVKDFSENRSYSKLNDFTSSVREQYILAKYCQDKSSRSFDIGNREYNNQLLACVRTSHVEITLRLLAVGANASYVEKDSGNTCMHIAAREGQDLQVELLFLFGADPSIQNKNGFTPYNMALSHAHEGLAERLLEMNHHVIVELSKYAKKARKFEECDTETAQPFFITSQSMKLAKILKVHINSCSEKQFKKLLQDIYDEMERRKTLSDWLQIKNGALFLQEVKAAAFLPLIASYSSMRNQYRQKIAKLDFQQFVLLITHVLKEFQRRSSPNAFVDLSCDAVDYDTVAENRDHVTSSISSPAERKNISDASRRIDDRYDKIECSDDEKKMSPIKINESSVHLSEKKKHELSTAEHSKSFSTDSGTRFTTSCHADVFIVATERLTSDIRQLVKESQNEIGTKVAESFANIIGERVLALINCIPAEVKNEKVNGLIEHLWENVAMLSCKCNSPSLKSEEICSAAYDLARTTKNLLLIINY